MTRAIFFRPEAEEDLTEAFDWYEKAEAGLGFEFLRAVDVCVRFVHRQPLANAVVRRFPYGLFYVIEGRENHRPGLLAFKAKSPYLAAAKLNSKLGDGITAPRGLYPK